WPHRRARGDPAQRRQGSGVLAVTGPGPPLDTLALARGEHVGSALADERRVLLPHCCELLRGATRECDTISIRTLEDAADRADERLRERLREPGQKHGPAGDPWIDPDPLPIPVDRHDAPSAAGKGEGLRPLLRDAQHQWVHQADLGGPCSTVNWGAAVNTAMRSGPSWMRKDSLSMWSSTASPSAVAIGANDTR